jgi:hypothetical protein
MNTPAAALTWEFWRRYRRHLLRIAGIILVLAVFYPRLCALDGFNPRSPDAFDDLVHRLPVDNGHAPGLEKILSVMYFLVLALGPPAAMVTTLLYVVWMSTFTEVNQKTKDPMEFPGRLFLLPISTSFLFWRMVLGGIATLSLVYAGWVYLVPVPHVEVFDFSRNLFAWLAILVTTQAIVWSFAAWPFTRMLVLMGLFLGFMTSFEGRDMIQSPFVLSGLFILGTTMAYIGLQKMRHGQWQPWTWKWRAARAQLRGPKRFASPAQAQLWFEWRRFGRGLFITVAAMAALSIIIQIIWRSVEHLGPLEPETTTPSSAI